LPAKERLLVEAWKAHQDGHDDEAERLYARALEAFPMDWEVLFRTMNFYFTASRWEEALPILRRLHALDRDSAEVRLLLWECLGALDLAAERLALARDWAEESPGGQLQLAEALGDAGQLEEAIAVSRRATELDDRVATRLAWAEALMRAGRYPEAEAVLRPLVAPTRSGGPSVRGMAVLATALDYQGRHREAWAAVASIPNPDVRDYSRLMHLFCLSCRPADGEVQRLARSVLASGYHASEWLPLHLLIHGEAREAADLATRFASGGQGMRQYRALVAWKSGERERALAELEAMARRGPSYSRPAAGYLLAALAREEGRDGDLVALVDKLGRAAPSAWHDVAYPESLYWASLAHDRLGQRDLARARIEQLLGFWAKADPDLPLLAEARALRQRLEKQAAGPGGKP
jgi:tetratricopeptide (TPR) repeat protein